MALRKKPYSGWRAEAWKAEGQSEREALFGLGGEDGAEVIVLGDIHHPNHIINGHALLRLNGDAGVVTLLQELYNLTLQLRKGGNRTIQIVVPLRIDGDCHIGLRCSLVGALREHELQGIGVHNGGCDHEEYEQ